MNKPTIKWTVAAGVMTMVAGCASMPWETPQRKEGVQPGSTIAQNAEESPDRMAYLKEQETRSMQRMEDAEKASMAGDLDKAETILREALEEDPRNNRAMSELERIANLRRHPAMVDEARELLEKGDDFGAEKRVRQVLMEDPKNRAAMEIYTEILKKREDRRILTPVLKSISNKPISLEFRDANLKMVFEALSKSTGINFILDKDIRQDQKTTVFIHSAPLQEVLDSLLTANQLQKKIINENTMVVYPNTPIKAKEYQELVMRTFYLANADVKQTAALLKSMLQIKDIFTDEKINLVVIRDTLEAVRMAEQLILAQDVADPEVVLDVEILEVNRNKVTELGIKFPDQISVIPDLTWRKLRNLSSDDIGVTPNPNIKFKSTEHPVNLLANPSIRVRNREKARIHVGNRRPIITTNVSQGGAGLISETVQYIDDGLKLEVEPTVNIDDEVSIKIALDYSSSTETGKAYTIATRNAITLLRLKDGETQVLAGLIQDLQDISKDKVPGLGDIPLLGRIFGQQKTTRDKTDLILSITPHVIRNLPAPTAAKSEMVIGTEAALGRIPTRVGAGGVPPALAPFMTQPRGASSVAPATAPAQGSSAGQNQAQPSAGDTATPPPPANEEYGLGLPKPSTLPLGPRLDK